MPIERIDVDAFARRRHVDLDGDDLALECLTKDAPRSGAPGAAAVTRQLRARYAHEKLLLWIGHRKEA